MALSTGIEAQIRLMFERDNLNSTEIAEILNMEVQTVELCLAKKEKNLRKNDNELRNKIAGYRDDALAVIEEIMNDREAPASVRLSAALYVVDEGIGQKPDKLQAIPEGINLTTIQNYFIAAKEKHSKAKPALSENNEIITVDATVTS